MSNSCLKMIKDLIIFYVKENYKSYLIEKNIKVIENKDLDTIINELYTQKKEHLKKIDTLIRFLSDNLEKS